MEPITVCSGVGGGIAVSISDSEFGPLLVTALDVLNSPFRPRTAHPPCAARHWWAPGRVRSLELWPHEGNLRAKPVLGGGAGRPACIY